jgi:ABC-type Na+ efflux pump permease subunit
LTVFGGIWLAYRAFRGKVGAVQAGYGFLESDLKRISWVIGSGAAFILTFYLFGYFLAIIVGYTLMLLSFGVRDKIKILFSTLLMAFVFQWLFMGVMRLNDPSGALLDLRTYTNIISGE